MLRVLVLLIGLLGALSSQAQGPEELIENLRSRLYPLASSEGKLIRSYDELSQSYVYDQALAIIAFSRHGDKKNARSLLLGLLKLQLEDGSFYFSYNLDGSSIYPVEGDRRIAGSIAWVALAGVHYQKVFDSAEFVLFTKKILTFLQSQMAPVKVKNKVFKALRFSPSDLKTSGFDETSIFALEHNLDAYAAFSHFETLNGSEFPGVGSDLKKFILSLWDKEKSHFWSGVDAKTGTINKSEYYLDNQTWSILTLSIEDLRLILPDEALEKNCKNLYVKHLGIEGFVDMKSVRLPIRHKFVWSEGTLGQVLAMKKIKKESCGDKRAEEYLEMIRKMKKPGNGIAYATAETSDFTTSSSVAGTSWFYFALNDINPFDL